MTSSEHKPHSAPDVALVRHAIDGAMIGEPGQHMAHVQLDGLIEQLKAYRRALEEIAKTEWFDGEDRFAGPDDIARMALAVSEVRHVGDGPEHLRYIDGWELNPARDSDA